MQLYFVSTSPYARKVKVLAMETGLEDRIDYVFARPSEPGHDLKERNPLGKIPTLIADDGMVIFDSPVICEYLDGLHGGAKLFPPAGPARWMALRQQATADGILDAALLRRGEEARREERQSKGWIAHQAGAMHRSLQSLNAEVDSLGAVLSIGQISIGCALGYLDFRFPDDDWRHLAPDLSDWYAGFSQRPSMTATVPLDPG
jgi:glutathione S-transferase